MRACVRIDDEYGEIPIGELQVWLERMTFLDDPGNPEWQEHPNPTPPGREFKFAIWDDKGTIWWLGVYDGMAQLRATPATPEAWLRDLRESPYEKGLREIEPGCFLARDRDRDRDRDLRFALNEVLAYMRGGMTFHDVSLIGVSRQLYGPYFRAPRSWTGA